MILYTTDITRKRKRSTQSWVMRVGSCFFQHVGGGSSKFCATTGGLGHVFFSIMSGVGHQNFVPLQGGGSCFFQHNVGGGSSKFCATTGGWVMFFWGTGFSFFLAHPPPPPVLFDQSLNDLRRLIPVAVASIFLKKNSGLDGNRTHDLCDVGADSLTTELWNHSW